MSQPDEVDALLDQVRSGDQNSVGLLFEQFRPKLRRLVSIRMDGRLKSRLSESDALQEIFIDVSQQIQRYIQNPGVSIYVWMRGIAAQRLQKLHRDHLAAQRRSVTREHHLPEQSSLLLGRQMIAGETGPSQKLAQKELRKLVQQTIDSLKEEDREIILLREFEDLPNSEVAELLGLSESAATMRHGRALHRLKEKFQTQYKSGGSL
jgi:RNA polymerase sigma-70 factor (ECF subfamily)